MAPFLLSFCVRGGVLHAGRLLYASFFFFLARDGPPSVFFNWQMNVFLRENILSDPVYRCDTENRDWLELDKN